MADDWESAADEDYDKKKFAGEDDEDAPDAWDVDEEEIKRKEAEKAAQQKAKLAEIQAKQKAKKDAEAKAAAAAKKAKEEENDPTAKYRRKAEEEAIAKKRDASLADDLFGGGGGDDDEEGEEGEWYEGEEGEEGEWYDDEEENDQSQKTKQNASKKPATAAAPASNKSTTKPAVANNKSLPKDEVTSFKVVSLGGTKPATTNAAAATASKSSAAAPAPASSIESMPLTNDEQFDVLANLLSKRIKSLAPNTITPSVHSARLLNRLLKPILSAACDVMKLDDVDGLKKLSMSLHQQKATFVKKNPPPAEKAAPVSRAGPGSNTLGRNIRATLNLRDDDDVFAAGVTGNTKNDGVFDDDSFM